MGDHDHNFLKQVLRILAVHCDQNNSYEITMNDYQARKINETFSFSFLT